MAALGTRLLRRRGAVSPLGDRDTRRRRIRVRAGRIRAKGLFGRRDFDRQLHETLGLTVFAIALTRLAWRAFDTTPDDPPMPIWMRLSSKVVQVTMYALLLLIPLTAISGAWLEGHPLTLFGNVRIGPLLAEAHSAGSAIASVHTWLGDTILWVAGVHAAAGLYHHFVLRDGVLRSMLPG
jgi:cytochrome b561